MLTLALLSALFALRTLGDLLNTQMPHLLIPLDSANPNQAYGTQKTGEVSDSVYTEVSFDVPGDIPAAICRINFHINTDDRKKAPRELSGDAPYSFNVWRLDPSVNQLKDTFNSHPSITAYVATVTVTPKGAVTVDGGWFDCPKWDVAQFLLKPVSTRKLRYWWFELDYSDAEGGKHGITLEMHS